MNQKIVLAIIAILGLTVGLVAGVMIANSKSKVVIADLQSKLQQSEAESQKRISNCDVTIKRLKNELQKAKIELVKLRFQAPPEEAAVVAATEGKKTAVASDDNSTLGTARLYTVEEGDSLWKIAASQLGDGNRYKEIIKLNPDVSADGSNLAVGTKLKMPTR